MARALQKPTRMALGLRARRGRGFTLIELSIVVTIVGVLAVIAVVAYRKLILNGKVTEAQNVIGAIRIAQSDFYAERGTYAFIGANLCPANQCPGNVCSGTTKTQWDSSCNGGTNTWQLLPVHVQDPVLFGYRTVGGTSLPASADQFALGWMSWGCGASCVGRPYFEIHAKADVNADGAGGMFTEFATTNFTNQIFGFQVGE